MCLNEPFECQARVIPEVRPEKRRAGLPEDGCEGPVQCLHPFSSYPIATRIPFTVRGLLPCTRASFPQQGRVPSELCPSILPFPVTWHHWVCSTSRGAKAGAPSCPPWAALSAGCW